jgi:type IV pilus assembly protein PilW
MRSKQQQASRHQTGFSLMEILVGLVVGLLATLVIMQVFSVFEGQKRTTTGSADAQSNGNIALFTIAQELKMAGYGLYPSDNSALECTTLNSGVPGIASTADLSPVIITDGSTLVPASPSDNITIHYARSNSGGLPSVISIVNSAGLNDVTIPNNMGCHVNDVAMIINGSTCSFSTVTGPTDIDIPAVPSSTPITNAIYLNTLTGAAVNANVSCLGAWNTTLFRVNPNYDPTVAAANARAYLEQNNNPSVADIVNIQAQYGISASGNNNQIINWVDATGTTWGAVPLAIADRNRIKAIHIAVVARNSLREKTIVTNSCTTSKGTVNKGPCAWDDSNVDAAPMIDLSKDPDWQYYRYRVFDTIIPLRDVIWSKDTL